MCENVNKSEIEIFYIEILEKQSLKIRFKNLVLNSPTLKGGIFHIKQLTSPV